jgi:hypothetical protein
MMTRLVLKEAHVEGTLIRPERTDPPFWATVYLVEGRGETMEQAIDCFATLLAERVRDQLRAMYLPEG